jgi:hypothetical protein
MTAEEREEFEAEAAAERRAALRDVCEGYGYPTPVISLADVREYGAMSGERADAYKEELKERKLQNFQGFRGRVL